MKYILYADESPANDIVVAAENEYNVTSHSYKRKTNIANGPFDRKSIVDLNQCTISQADYPCLIYEWENQLKKKYMRVRLLSQIKCDTTGAKCLNKTWRKYDTRKLEKENYQRTDHNHNDNIDYSYDYSFTPFPLSCILRVTFFTMVRNTYL